MKAFKYIIFIASLLSVCTIMGQNSIKFTYDDAGNRTKREILFKKNIERITDSTLVDQPIVDWLNEMKITIYPNPTKGLLTINIANMPKDVSGNFTLCNLEGRLIKQGTILSASNTIDLSKYVTGIYIFRIAVEQKSIEWKIIKE